MNKGSIISAFKKEIINVFKTLWKYLTLLLSLTFMAIIFMSCSIEIALLLALVYVILEFIKWAKRMEDAEVYAFPRSRRRYTHKKENGDIYINESDINRIIVYLSSIEDYAEERGYL